MAESKVILITGASTGIGRACAEFLRSKGYRVYGTSRRAPAETAKDGNFTLIRMDVTDGESVVRGVKLVIEREGRIDAVVNNAGAALVGPIEDTPMDVVEGNMNTNFFGALRVCQAAIPLMRAQGGGNIINISSIGGVIAPAYQGIYGATKFALEGMTEALRIEVRHFGIKVSLIEPGDIRTQDCRTKTTVSTAYQPYFGNAVKAYEADEEKGYPPERIGPLVARIIRSRNPALHYTFGHAFQSAVPMLKRLLPQRLVQWIFSLIYGC